MTYDPAFLWETEAMRETSRRRRDHGVDPGPSAGADWATLRDAHLATSIPLETIRKWARRDTIDSYLDEATNLRMVSLEAVRRRASSLGRETRPAPPPDSQPTPTEERQEPRGRVERTVIESHPTTAPLPSQPPPVEPTAPDGTMIVPIAAWDKMLMQLGNLHEAGQQLAEARERAAKAETEARFLRERLAEIRVERRVELETPPAEEVDASPILDTVSVAPEPLESAASPQPQPLWRYVYTGWRQRRRRRAR